MRTGEWVNGVNKRMSEWASGPTCKYSQLNAQARVHYGLLSPISCERRVGGGVGETNAIKAGTLRQLVYPEHPIYTFYPVYPNLDSMERPGSKMMLPALQWIAKKSKISRNLCLLFAFLFSKIIVKSLRTSHEIEVSTIDICRSNDSPNGVSYHVLKLEI